MANLPGPYEIEFTLTGWTAPAREHVFRVNVAAVGSPAVGALPTAIDIQKMGGSTAKLNIVANQIWEFLRLFNNASITCSGYQLWKYVPGTLGKDFISTGAVTNPACNDAGGVNAAQLTQTYRSANGGILKVVMLESNQAGDARVTLVPNAAGTPSQKLAAYIMSADNVFLARDDAYPVNPLRDSRGQNEKIWRLINR
jgi:hypothetical protein